MALSVLLKMQVRVLKPLVLSKEFLGDLHSKSFPYTLTIFFPEDILLSATKMNKTKKNMQ